MLRPLHPLPSPPAPPPAPRRTSWQLPLPLAASAAADGALAPPLAPAGPAVADRALHEVWPSLSPAMQAQVRGVLCRILQEVVRDARHG
jgi:hypothetical protein